MCIRDSLLYELLGSEPVLHVGGEAVTAVVDDVYERLHLLGEVFLRYVELSVVIAVDIGLADADFNGCLLYTS